MPATGGWQTWTTVSRTVNVNAGTYNFGVYAQTGGYNLNWVCVTKTAARAALASADALNKPAALTLYPNPVTDRLTLEAPAELLGRELSIVGVDGRQVWRGTYHGQPLDVSALRPGLYTLVMLGLEGQKQISRFSKE